MTVPPHRRRRGSRPGTAAGSPYQAPRRPPLAAGELRALVLGHLQAYPGLDFSPAEIANVLHRSRGAVVNACQRLVSQGLATRTRQHPQRYQATSPADAD